MITFCPATFCPLFAKDGSPWTGKQNGHCIREECGWWNKGQCVGAESAVESVYETRTPLRMAPRVFDCPRAHECQWQHEAGDGLCPPRLALSLGVDPKHCTG